MIGSMEHDYHEEGIGLMKHDYYEERTGLMEHDYYEQEDRIIWLANRESLAKMGYVRERFQIASIRSGPVGPPSGEELVGYAVLKQTAAREPGKGFRRRIFTLQPVDRYYDPQGIFRDCVPPEAIDPLKVQAGKPSESLARESLFEGGSGGEVRSDKK
jgi:hypothetical protein